MRGLCVILHRYIGLATALFLVLLGLTGSVLAWREPVSAWLAPELQGAPARGPVLTTDQLAQRAAVADPRSAGDYGSSASSRSCGFLSITTWRAGSGSFISRRLSRNGRLRAVTACLLTTAAVRSLTCGRQRDPADLFMNWLSALHMGEVFGIPYKVLLCLLGLVVAGLSATGVLIWWRKLQSRHAMHRRKIASSGSLRLAARSLAALLCLVAGILLAGALTGTFQNVL
jgi:uncharacterized iron-regulated membrane protein